MLYMPQFWAAILYYHVMCFYGEFLNVMYCDKDIFQRSYMFFLEIFIRETVNIYFKNILRYTIKVACDAIMHVFERSLNYILLITDSNANNCASNAHKSIYTVLFAKNNIVRF